MSELVWIASYPKSGNTWVRAVLANYVLDRDVPVPINGLSRFTLGDGFLRHYEIVGGRRERDLDDQAIVRLRSKVQRWFLNAAKGYAFIKTHNAFTAVGGIDLFEGGVPARAIYIVRNPLDVAVSYASFLGVTVDVAINMMVNKEQTIARDGIHAAQYVCDWSTHVRRWTRQRTMIVKVLRFEEMLAEPHAAFATMILFLGLPYQSGRLAKAIRFSSFEELAKQERESGFNEVQREGATFFRSGRKEDWKEQMCEAEVGRIVRAHRAEMEAFGYETP